MSGERKLKGFATKLVPKKGSAMWAAIGSCGALAGLTPRRGTRQVYGTYVRAVERGLAELRTLLAYPIRHASIARPPHPCACTFAATVPLAEPHLWRIRIVAIYTRPKRTAEQERADVVAWLRLKVESESAYRFATGIEQGQHVGAAK